MIQPGRKSAAKLSLVELNPARTLLAPVVPLDKLALKIFNLAVNRSPHLKLADAVLLTAYSQAAARVLQASNKASLVDVERATRVMVSLARSLRLTPRSVTDPKTVGTSRRDAQPNPLAEYLAEREEEAEDGSD
jgi:hypothetical protein